MRVVTAKVIVSNNTQNKTFYGDKAKDKAIRYAEQIKSSFATVWIETVEVVE